MMTIESASGGFETSYGRINSEWKKRQEGGYLYKCDIPCNTSATIRLSLSDKTYEQEVGSGHYEFICHNSGDVEILE
jgi:hypothetical protein